MAQNITVTVSLSIKLGMVDTFLTMLPDLQTETMTRPGVVSVRALYNPERPTKLVFLDVFESVAASEGYFRWRGERGDLDKLEAMLTEPPKIETWPVSMAPKS